MGISTARRNERIGKCPVVQVTLANSRCCRFHTVINGQVEGYNRVATGSILKLELVVTTRCMLTIIPCERITRYSCGVTGVGVVNRYIQCYKRVTSCFSQEEMLVTTGSDDSSIRLSPVIGVTFRYSRSCHLNRSIDRHCQCYYGIAAQLVSEYMLVRSAGKDCSIRLCPVIRITCRYRRSSNLIRQINNQVQLINYMTRSTYRLSKSIIVINSGQRISLSVFIPSIRAAYLNRSSHVYRIIIARRNEIVNEITAFHCCSALCSNDIAHRYRCLVMSNSIRHIQPCTAYVNLPLGTCYRHCQFVCICSELGQEGSDCTGGINSSIIRYERLKDFTLYIKNG